MSHVELVGDDDGLFVSLHMTKREAEVIRFILGAVGGHSEKSERRIANEIRQQFDAVGIGLDQELLERSRGTIHIGETKNGKNLGKDDVLGALLFVAIVVDTLQQDMERLKLGSIPSSLFSAPYGSPEPSTTPYKTTGDEYVSGTGAYL